MTLAPLLGLQTSPFLEVVTWLSMFRGSTSVWWVSLCAVRDSICLLFHFFISFIASVLIKIPRIWKLVELRLNTTSYPDYKLSNWHGLRNTPDLGGVVRPLSLDPQHFVKSRVTPYGAWLLSPITSFGRQEVWVLGSHNHREVSFLAPKEVYST